MGEVSASASAEAGGALLLFLALGVLAADAGAEDGHELWIAAESASASAVLSSAMLLSSPTEITLAGAAEAGAATSSVFLAIDLWHTTGLNLLAPNPLRDSLARSLSVTKTVLYLSSPWKQSVEGSCFTGLLNNRLTQSNISCANRSWSIRKIRCFRQLSENSRDQEMFVEDRVWTPAGNFAFLLVMNKPLDNI